MENNLPLCNTIIKTVMMYINYTVGNNTKLKAEKFGSGEK